MADVIALPIPQQIPIMPGGVLHPWFDQPAPVVGALGIPWWFVICCIFILGFVLTQVSWIFKFKRMAAVKGFKEIQKRSSPDEVMTWLFTKTQRTLIEALKYAGGVASYYSPIRISKWHLTSPMSMAHVGGYPAMLVSDDYDQSRDPVSEIAITRACEELNSDPEIWTRIRAKVEEMGDKLPAWFTSEVMKPIESFTDYKERGHIILKLRYPEGIPIPAYSIFNPTKFRRYFPKGRDATFFGGVLLRKSRKLKMRVPEKGFWEKILPIAVPLVLVIIAIIGAWAAPLGK
jgi:hypothetical protein